ncbi:metallophosphoesterase [Frigoribacterium sp. PhB118]|uniref:metallophosphoesterase family protein n=1 Tax=Frigoribacterium sp. PhB118 TaxID=2485175 RepID=UPI000F4A80E3|nr:metallophosphoesterase [Frigoribacterium sp. PhB118]ROS56577.1 calcineurin-like phosphoesterase family protein [Frigoribacterium sp. PhB118]
MGLSHQARTPLATHAAAAAVTSGGAFEERFVAIAGDWHSNRAAARRAMRLVHLHSPEVVTFLHLGDFNLGSEKPWAAYRKFLAEAMREYGVRRMLVTPGNHDNWERLAPRFAEEPNTPYSVPHLESVAFLPRGYQFSLGGRSFLSFGGAASPDQEKRVRGKDWWPEEEPTRAEADLAGSTRGVDVLLTHEAVNGGTAKVDRVLANPNLRLFSEEGLRASSRSRSMVTDVWHRTMPRILFHGHMHVKAERRLPDDRRVYSLAADEVDGNVGILDLGDLSWTWLA